MRSFIVWIASAGIAGAQEWTPLDARTQALGGAGVAFAERDNAAFWNPALLADGAEKPFDFRTGFGFDVHVSFGYTLVGDVAGDLGRIVELYDEVDFEAIQDSINAGTSPTESDVQNLLRILDAFLKVGGEGEGLVFRAGTGLNIRVGPFSVFARGAGEAGLHPYVDPAGFGALTSDTLASFFTGISTPPALSAAGTQLALQLAAAGLNGDSDGDGVGDAAELAYQSQLALGDDAISQPGFQQALSTVVQNTLANQNGDPEATLFNSAVGVELRAFAQAEAGIGFGLPLIPTVLDVGISLKEVITETAYQRVTVAEYSSDERNGEDLSDALRDDLDSSRKRTTRFNADLAVRYTPFTWLSAAISARNVLPMSVDTAAPEGEIDLDPLVRAGVLFTPFRCLKVGADLDLLESESPVLPEHMIRNFGAGAELDLKFFRLRAGYTENLATPDVDGAVTGGFGFDVFGVKLEIGALYALEDTAVIPDDVGVDVDALDLPQRVSLAVSLGVDVRF
jgi:hypothetical protein